jgi:putative two-component system response regulator
LAGEQIPIHGRIAAVADVYDALTRDRPYREAMPAGEATGLMADGRGVHFDPDVLDTFMASVPVPA